MRLTGSVTQIYCALSLLTASVCMQMYAGDVAVVVDAPYVADYQKQFSDRYTSSEPTAGDQLRLAVTEQALEAFKAKAAELRQKKALEPADRSLLDALSGAIALATFEYDDQRWYSDPNDITTALRGVSAQDVSSKVPDVFKESDYVQKIAADFSATLDRERTVVGPVVPPDTPLQTAADVVVQVQVAVADSRSVIVDTDALLGSSGDGLSSRKSDQQIDDALATLGTVTASVRSSADALTKALSGDPSEQMRTSLVSGLSRVLLEQEALTVMSVKVVVRGLRLVADQILSFFDTMQSKLLLVPKLIQYDPVAVAAVKNRLADFIVIPRAKQLADAIPSATTSLHESLKTDLQSWQQNGVTGATLQEYAEERLSQVTADSAALEGALKQVTKDQALLAALLEKCRNQFMKNLGDLVAMLIASQILQLTRICEVYGKSAQDIQRQFTIMKKWKSALANVMITGKLPEDLEQLFEEE